MFILLQLWRPETQNQSLPSLSGTLTGTYIFFWHIWFDSIWHSWFGWSRFQTRSTGCISFLCLLSVFQSRIVSSPFGPHAAGLSKELDQLPRRMSFPHILGLTASLHGSLICSSVPCASYKLKVRSKGLISYRVEYILKQNWRSLLTEWMWVREKGGVSVGLLICWKW